MHKIVEDFKVLVPEERGLLLAQDKDIIEIHELW